MPLQANLKGLIFYKKTGDKWCFITAEEFAENVSKDNIVKWDNKKWKNL